MAGESRTAHDGPRRAVPRELEQIDRRIRPGTIFGVGPTIAALADADLPRDETPREAIAPVAATWPSSSAAKGWPI